jgi:hypothetical protein
MPCFVLEIEIVIDDAETFERLIVQAANGIV